MMSKLSLNKSANSAGMELGNLPQRAISNRLHVAPRSQDVVEDAYLKAPESTFHTTTTKLSERTKRAPNKQPSIENRDKKSFKFDDVLGSTERFGTVSEAQARIVEAEAEADADAEQSLAPMTNAASQTRVPSPKTAMQKRNAMIQFISLCWCIWLGGWNDGSTGPLLPRLQEHYNVGYTVVSLIFVGSCFGFICGAFLNIWLNDRVGIGKILVIGAICQLCGYAIITPSPPFPLLVCAYYILGFGLSLQNAQANGFVANLRDNMSTKLGIIQGVYGLGAFSSPFASTYFAKLPGRRQWSYHFILSAAFCVVNIASLIYVFRFRRQEELLRDAGEEHNTDVGHQQREQQQQGDSQYRQIFSLKSVPLFAVFALIYVGVEVTIGGWIVTFIIHERGGGSSTGYISSGFFGGLALGRVSLMWLNKMIGEHRIVILYALIAIAFELTVWFVPSIIENAVAVSLVGLVLGPMFPLLVLHMTHILPRWLLTGCVGLVTGIGVAGSAALPFVTGLLASRFGIGSIQPLMISMMSVMLVVWSFVPKAARRVE